MPGTDGIPGKVQHKIRSEIIIIKKGIHLLNQIVSDPNYYFIVISIGQEGPRGEKGTKGDAGPIGK